MDWMQLTDQHLALLGCLLTLGSALALLKISYDTRPELRACRIATTKPESGEATHRQAA